MQESRNDTIGRQQAIALTSCDSELLHQQPMMRMPASDSELLHQQPMMRMPASDSELLHQQPATRKKELRNRLLNRTSSGFKFSKPSRQRSMSFEPDYDPSAYWKRKVSPRSNDRSLPKHLQGITPEKDQELLTKYVDQIIRWGQFGKFRSALYTSGLANRYDLIDQLIKESGKTDSINNPIRAAIDGAVEAGHCKLMKKLLKRCSTDEYSSILCLAIEMDQLDVVIELLNMGVGKYDGGIDRALTRAIECGRLRIVSELIGRVDIKETNSGIIHERDFDLNIAIVTAVKHNQQGLFSVLIGEAAKNEIYEALMWAIKWCYPSMTEEILKRRANELDLDGALIEAAVTGNVKNVLLLIEYGAKNINEASKIARQYNHSALTRRLMLLILDLLTTRVFSKN